MKIQDNILKFYLKNCYFITGTAYAGKSTMCTAKKITTWTQSCPLLTNRISQT